MKKFILPLLFLLAVGMLVAVESDPSAVVGYVKYPCVAGGNTLIALPMEAGFATAGAVGVAVGGGCDAVSIYLPTQAWKTTFDIGDGFEEDFAISGIGTPLQVYSYTPFTWPSRGSSNGLKTNPNKSK